MSTTPVAAAPRGGRDREASPYTSFGALPPSQTCPACDGILPIEAVTVGLWTLAQSPLDAWQERTIKMCCPHCGERRKRIERRPL